MADTAVQRFYKYHARVYDSTRWMILHRRARAVELLNLRPDAHALEIGCGTGLNFSYVLDALDPQRGRLTALDFSQDMLDRAQRRVEARGWKNVELVQGDATRLALGRRFDAILFAYSLTMIPDWQAALEHARDHLAPGGRLVVLDFGPFRGWGPLAPLMRAWLRANHVETLQPYVETATRVFNAVGGDVQVEYWAGGYAFLAVARRPAGAP